MSVPDDEEFVGGLFGDEGRASVGVPNRSRNEPPRQGNGRQAEQRVPQREERRPSVDQVKQSPVRSRPLVSPVQPISRLWLDRSSGIFRAGAGVILAFFSLASTVLVFSGDLLMFAELFPSFQKPAVRYAIATLVGLVLFGGELFTSESHPRVYWTLMTFDTLFTSRQLAPFFEVLFGNIPLASGVIIATGVWLLLLNQEKKISIPVCLGILFIVSIIGYAGSDVSEITGLIVWITAFLWGYWIAISAELLILGARR